MDIGQIIFSCKQGVSPTDILIQKKLNLITDFDNFLLMYYLYIYYINKIIFEPLPNIQNKSIVLDQTKLLADSSNNIYNIKVRDNLEKKEIAIDNNCISNILDF